MKKTEHTPGQWVIYDDGRGPESSDIIMAHIDGDNFDICAMSTELPVDERKANAEFIVRACNAHDDLLEALKTLLAYANDYSDAMAKEGKGAEQLGALADSVSVAGMARAAIAKATSAD